MIVFNECRIDKEGKNLIIDVSIDSLSYYKNLYITEIIVDTDKTFIDSGKPSENYIYSKEFINSNLKNLRCTINYKELELDNLNDNILFVYIKVRGIPESDCPCSMDKEYSMAVAVNMRPIYNIAMEYIKELNSTCNIPKRFIDMILRLKAFELSLKTGNFLTAIKQWDKLFKSKKLVSSSNNCGCNGSD